ncbi:hypothetical protein DFH28DRAFT_942840 [Melampsora americana]|nr:hypothetical protein DFH28DRAFT_942840 [Melampsora americana]
MVFPITGNLKPNFVNSDRLSTQAAKDNPPAAPSVHDLDIQPAPPPPAPSIPEAKIVEEPKREPTPIPANPEPTPIVEVETERPKSIQQQIEEAEENALYEKLLKVAANSPLPSPLTHPMDELLEELSHHSRAPSIIPSQLQTPILNEAILDPVPSIHDRSPNLENGMMTPIEEVIAREEEDELREKLFKIISSPVPVTPLVYSSHVSTPHLSVNPSKSINHTPIISQSKEEKEEDELREKLLKIVATPRNVKLPESHLGSPLLKKTEPMKSPIGLPTHTPLSESMKEEEEEIAVYAAKISKRLDEAILKSPFIKSQLLSPLLSPKAQSIRSSKKSVGSKSISNHKSNSTSKSTTPKSISRSTTPKSSSIQVVAEEEEEIPIPGSFVNTPKSTYLKSPLPNPPSLFDCQHSESNEIHSKGKSQRRMSVATNHTHRSNSPLFSC